MRTVKLEDCQPLSGAARAEETARIHASARRLADIGFYLCHTKHPGDLVDDWTIAASLSADDRKRLIGYGKEGTLSDWPHTASKNAAQIDAWFSGRLRNIAIALGLSGLVVIDEDKPNAFMELWNAHSKDFIRTFTVTTGRGYHFYFRAPERFAVDTTTRKVLKDRGIEVKTPADCVHAPGSRHGTGRVYEPLSWGASIADMPDWLTRLLQGSHGRPASTRRAGIDKTTGPWREYQRLKILNKGYRLERIEEEIISAPPGGGNEALFNLACRAYELSAVGIEDEAEVETLLMGAATYGARRPESEARVTMASARRTVYRDLFGAKA